jgi:hypothetical protein
LNDLRDRWAAQWPAALAQWSRYTKLSEPRWCFTQDDEQREELSGSFAMIRLNDHAVVVSLRQIAERKLEAFGLEILAHEIGHHVFCPADLSDNARLIARIRYGLPSKEHLAGMVSNLYSDLLINDRLQRGGHLRMAQVYQALGGGPADRLWAFYLRIYEILWSQTRGALVAPAPAGDAQLEGDAQLGARLVRHYAREWLDGAGKFAALCLPYVLEDEAEARDRARGWRDMEQAGRGGLPHGLTEVDDDERTGAIHPAYDPALADIEMGDDGDEHKTPLSSAQASPGGSKGQHREPFEYGAILRSLSLKLDDHELAVRYYRERATPHLIHFPQRTLPESTDPLPEGLESWDIGSPLADVDWMESVIRNPHVVPGFSTVQRVWGLTQGGLPQKEPLDLDLYVDCSGSMPNPQVNTSYLTLAGAIIALSALRTGARVQATLWSGPRQFKSTDGFVRNEAEILRILTGYLGGSTAFPIHVLARPTRTVSRRTGPCTSS